MSVRTAPCDWNALNSCPCDIDGITPEIFQASVDIATEILWSLSGRRFGLCPTVVRPCGRPCGNSSPMVWSGPSFYPLLTGDGWINCVSGDCGCADSCSCCKRCSVSLPGPVDSITAVSVNGVLIDPTTYRVDDFRDLVRIDGDCWPRCPDLSAPVGEPATFAVSYLQGVPVPIAGQRAAGAYACEIAKSCVGLPCSLPERVTSITREGVTMAILDPQDFLNDGLTGFPQADLWIRSVNPARLAQASRVYSPDVRPGYVQTWP